MLVVCVEPNPGTFAWSSGIFKVYILSEGRGTTPVSNTQINASTARARLPLNIFTHKGSIFLILQIMFMLQTPLFYCINA